MGRCQRSLDLFRNAMSTGIILLTIFEIIAVVGGVPTVPTQPSSHGGNERDSPGGLQQDTLIFTQVMFRHGNRTPDATTFPKDHYKDFQYPPYGRGHLTLGGKKLSFENGQFLRKRYGRFLGDAFSPEIMSLKSSSYARTQMTAALVSAGLWPPSKNDQWGENLGTLWQPAYIETRDLYFWGSVWEGNCPAFFRETRRVFQMKKVKNILRKFDHFRKRLTKYSGLNVRIPYDGYIIYHALLGQEEYGLKLPKWSEKVYPHKLHTFASTTFRIDSLTRKLKKIRSGLLIKDILSNFALVATDSLKPKTRKISLYSAHDITLVGLLQAFKVFNNIAPPHGCMLMMELHSIPSPKYHNDEPKLSDGSEKQREMEAAAEASILDILGLPTSDKTNSTSGQSTFMESLKRYGVKLFLRNSSFHDPYPLTMPKCGHPCRLDQFALLVAPIIPKNLTEECQ